MKKYLENPFVELMEEDPEFFLEFDKKMKRKRYLEEIKLEEELEQNKAIAKLRKQLNELKEQMRKEGLID